jgi:hypothetical protein
VGRVKKVDSEIQRVPNEFLGEIVSLDGFTDMPASNANAGYLGTGPAQFGHRNGRRIGKCLFSRGVFSNREGD